VFVAVGVNEKVGVNVRVGVGVGGIFGVSVGAGGNGVGDLVGIGIGVQTARAVLLTGLYFVNINNIHPIRTIPEITIPK